MGTGWNSEHFEDILDYIITDWDMGTGWNVLGDLVQFPFDYNRLGYGYWLELTGNCPPYPNYYNRLGYGYWLELPSL